MSHVTQAAEAPNTSPEDNVATQSGPLQSNDPAPAPGPVPDASTAHVANNGMPAADDLPEHATQDGRDEPGELEVDDVRTLHAGVVSHLDRVQI